MTKEKKPPQHKATHQGKLKIGGITIPCAVLENKERVISVRGVANALGTKGGGAYWKLKKAGKQTLPEFISAQALAPYIKDENNEIISGTVSYITKNEKAAVGLRADILPKICDIWIRALNDGVLSTNQRKIARVAYILMSAFAKLGITALIDEATGYQKDKD